MKYVVMNRNSLEGYEKGYFEQLPPCFYEEAFVDEQDNVRYRWTPVLGLAHRFNSEQEAWNFAKAVWGLKFVFTNYLIVSVHQEGLDRSLDHRDIILERYSNG